MILHKSSIIVGCYVLTVLLNNWLQSNRIHIQQPPIMPAVIFLSLQSIVADYYWFKLSIGSYQSNIFYDWIEYITDLDPHFNTIYRFAMSRAIIENDQQHMRSILIKCLQSPVNQMDWRMSWYSATIQNETNGSSLMWSDHIDLERLQLLGIVVPMPHFVAKSLKKYSEIRT